MKAFLAVLILVAVAAALYHRWEAQRTPSSLADCRRTQKNLATSLEMYSTDYAGRYPPRLELLVPLYLKELPTCPSTGRFTYTDYQCVVRPDLYSFSCVGDNHAHHYGKPSPNFPRYNALQGAQEP